MDSPFLKRLEVIANLAVIVVAVLLSTVLVKNYLLPESADPLSSAATNTVQAGSKLNLQGQDWTKSKQTLVLGLSSTCHYCTESGAFYRRLVEKKASVRLVAVFPQTADEGKKYLAALGVSVDDIKQLSFESIGISGTPTLILVNDAGIVTDIWQGKLDPDEEAKVLERL